MTIRKWNIGITILFIIFICLLVSFLLSTLRIRELVQPILSRDEYASQSRHIVMIAQELDNPYWRSIEEGARKAAVSLHIELDYVGPFRINTNDQMKLLEKAIAAKVDAVLLQGINDPAYKSLIKKAVDLGIAVITIDSDEPGSNRLYYVGSNNLEAGRMMGELVAKTAGNKNQVEIGVLFGNELSPNQILRLQGFREIIAQYPSLKIVDVRSSNISRLQAAKESEEILIQFPKIKYMVGLSALDGIGMLQTKVRTDNEDLHIFAFDDLAETIEGIRAGSINSTIIQQPLEMGYEAITVLDQYFQGQLPPNQIYTATSILDRSNLEDRKIGASIP